MNKEEAIALARIKIPKFVAQDKDGSWWVYFSKPTISGDIWDLNSLKASMRLSKADKKRHIDWKESLEEL